MTSPELRLCVRQRLAALLRTATPSGFEVVTGPTWRLGTGEFAPDVMVRPSDAHAPPSLVAEVVPPDHDLPVKVGPYAASGLQFLWVIDVRDRVADAYALEPTDCRRVGSVASDGASGTWSFGVGTVLLDLGALLGEL